MYVADAVGYLRYALVVILKPIFGTPEAILPFFLTALWVVAAGSIVAFLAALVYFHRVLPGEEHVVRMDDSAVVSEGPETTS